MTDKTFNFSFADPSIPSENAPAKPDTRSWTERMFADHDPVSGEAKMLPVKAQDCSQVSKIGDVKTGSNCLPVLLNFGGDVETYKGPLNEEHVLVLGGSRVGKAGQGRIYIPLSQVDVFVEKVLALRDAVEGEVPKLLESIGQEDPAEEA